MRVSAHRGRGDWSPLRLGRIGIFVAGTGFPHEFQGVLDAELPFFKVSDTNLPGNERDLRHATNMISRATARRLGARLCPAGAIVFPKVGAALLGNKRRLTIRESVFDNNMMGFVPYKEYDPQFLLHSLGDIDFGRLSNPGPVPSVNESDLRDVEIPVPSLAMQRIVAEFLDRKIAIVDSLMVKKERLLALLREKRQAIVTEAVTRGLDIETEMRETEEPFVGTIPRHWRLMKISKVATKLCNGFVGPTRDILVEDGVPYLQSLHIKGGRIAFEKKYFVSAPWLGTHARVRLREHDVLIVQTGDIGQVAAVPKEWEGAGCHALIIFRPHPAIGIGEYFSAFLRSVAGQNLLLREQTGALHPHLEVGNVRELFVPLPPVDEQHAIVKRIAVVEKEADRREELLLQQLTLLREYRRSLISAAVTGQLALSREAA